MGNLFDSYNSRLKSKTFKYLAWTKLSWQWTLWTNRGYKMYYSIRAPFWDWHHWLQWLYVMKIPVSKTTGKARTIGLVDILYENRRSIHQILADAFKTERLFKSCRLNRDPSSNFFFKIVVIILFTFVCNSFVYYDVSIGHHIIKLQIIVAYMFASNS